MRSCPECGREIVSPADHAACAIARTLEPEPPARPTLAERERAKADAAATRATIFEAVEATQGPATCKVGSEPAGNRSGRGAAAPTATLAGPSRSMLGGPAAAMLRGMSFEDICAMVREIVGGPIRLDQAGAAKAAEALAGVVADPWTVRRLGYALIERSVVTLGRFQPVELDAFAKLPEEFRESRPNAGGYVRVDREPPPPQAPPVPRVD